MGVRESECVWAGLSVCECMSVCKCVSVWVCVLVCVRVCERE